MARISAWLAVVVGVVIAVAIALRAAHFDLDEIGPIATAVLLLLGAYRTLTAKSGGLRLLCGAWGLAAGMAWYAPSYDAPDFIPGLLAIGAPVVISAIGLALVVLHKEQKKPA
jgi:hypothetical protein